MEARLSVNMNLNTLEECYGVAIQMEPKRKFCKYLYGHQAYKTKDKANKAVTEVNSKLKNGYAPVCKKSVNRAEYVIIERISPNAH